MKLRNWVVLLCDLFAALFCLAAIQAALRSSLPMPATRLRAEPGQADEGAS